jgi:hypothetical protein
LPRLMIPHQGYRSGQPCHLSLLSYFPTPRGRQSPGIEPSSLHSSPRQAIRIRTGPYLCHPRQVALLQGLFYRSHLAGLSELFRE